MSGNTKKIAYAIHTGICRAGEQCDIARLKIVRASDLVEYNLIGLGSPVIARKELPNVTSFIENTMSRVDGKYGFAFCTHGALPGRYLARVVPAMRQRGLTIIGWNDWFGGAYYPVVPKPYFTDGHPDEIDLKEAENFGKEMVERCQKISQGETGLIPEFPGVREYDEIYEPAAMPSEDILADFFKAEADIEFKVNTETCNYP